MVKMWSYFRRLLLGTVLESVQEQGIALNFTSIRIQFDPESEFKVPRLDNYMRFVGSFTGKTTAPVTTDQKDRLAAALRTAWADLVDVLIIPGDKLAPTRQDIKITVTGDQFVLKFDLVAD